MKRNILVEEIMNFCLDYGVFIELKEIKSKIKQGLEQAELIESLINTIFLKAKSSKNMDIERVKELLIELEEVRLDLEFKDYDLVHQDKRTDAYIKRLTR